jgi:Carboxypeptidase regulatory-like domain/TonB dependent receptor
MNRNIVRLISLLAILALFSIWAFGQAESGQITGLVTDTSGAVVSGAKVTVKSATTGATRNATTTSNGEYTVTNLKPDTYEVTIEGSGFQKYTRRVEVNVGSKNDVSAKLTVSGTSTTVEVTASEVAAVNTETQTLSTVVTSSQIAEMPTLTRNPYDLVATAGNVSDGDTGQSFRGAGFAINGQRSASTDILLDGGENVDLFTAGIGQSVPLDSVQEFRVVTSDFTAEYGRASGGVVNLTTKSGTNSLHGTAFEFNRVSALAANTYDNNAQRLGAFADGTCVVGTPCDVGKKGVFTRNQFGYSIGGPIVKNKLFFFSATEWTRVRSNSPVTQVIVDPAFLALPGVSPVTTAFFNTFGNNLRPGAVILNHIPFGDSGSSTLPAGDPFAETVQYSVPSDSGGGSPQNTYSNVDRVDYNLSDKTTLYGRYALYSAKFLPGTVNNSPYAGYDTGENDFNQNVTINLTHVFTPNFVSSSKVVYNRLNTIQPLGTNPVGPTLYVSSQGVPNFGPSQAQFVFPGYSQTTPGNAIPFGGPQNLYQFYEDINWTKGRHQFRFGGNYIHTRDNRVFGAYENAVEAFASRGVDPGAAADGLVAGTIKQFQGAIYPQGEFPCYRDLLTGHLIQTPDCTLTLPVGPPAFGRNNRYNDGAAYAQDSWKVVPRLTLNLGVRWEYFGVQHNANPALDSNFYFGSGATYQDRIRNGQAMIADKSPVGGLWAPQKHNFAPRLGFAWDIFGDGSTSLRGGYGLSYERNFGNVTFNVIQNPPNYAVISLVSGVDIPSMPIYTDNSGPLAGSGIQKAFPGPSMRAVDPHIKQAYAQFWSAAIERQVSKSSLVSIDYTGSKGTNEYSIANINKQYFGSTYLGDTRESNRLNQQYTNMNFRGSDGWNNYNAVNVKFSTNNLFNKGLFLNANYTWSHAMDDLSSTFSEGGNGNNQLGYTDPFNPLLDKGNSEYDIRHRFVVSGTWNLPGGHSSNGFVKQVIGGWSFSPIYHIRSGAPYTIYDCTNGVANCSRWIPTTGISATGNPVSIGFDNFQYLALPIDPNNTLCGNGADCVTNTGDALEVPNQQVFCGSAGPNNLHQYSCSGLPLPRRNSFVGASNWNFDMVMAKKFKLTERLDLQFRGELYNAFNHHNYYITAANADVYSFNQITARKGVIGFGLPDERRNVQFGVKLIF